MFAFFALAIFFHRYGFSIYLVTWTAFLLLLLRPESLLSPGFQMSFASVAALIAAWNLRKNSRRARFARMPDAALVHYGPGLRARLPDAALAYFAAVLFTTLVATWPSSRSRSTTSGAAQPTDSSPTSSPSR